MGNKLFIFIRSLIFPFNKVVEFIPLKGKILDVGCGHGTLTKLLAENSPYGKVMGIDPDKRKIATAKQFKQKNLNFRVARLSSNLGKFDVIIFTDVLYLLSQEEKIKMLNMAKKILTPRGTIIVIETPVDSFITKFLLNLEETLMTKVFRLTHTTDSKVHLLTQSEYEQIFRKSGLLLSQKRELWGILPYKHVLFNLKIKKQ